MIRRVQVTVGDGKHFEWPGHVEQQKVGIEHDGNVFHGRRTWAETGTLVMCGALLNENGNEFNTLNKNNIS
jgi:hypothetical protein